MDFDSLIWTSRQLNQRREMKACFSYFKLLVACQVLCCAVASEGRPSSYVSTIPRGGWFGSRKAASERYCESLEQQVLQLDRKLRQARDEVGQLRDRRKHSRPINGSNNKVSDDEKSDLEDKIASLIQQISDYENSKSELDSALEKSNLKEKERAEQLKAQQKTNKELEERCDKQKRELEMKNDDASSQNQKLIELECRMEERVAQASQAGRLEVEEEFASKIQQMKEELESAHQDELEAEQRRGKEAVDEEKKKMRKLVKALAIREKKLADQ